MDLPIQTVTEQATLTTRKPDLLSLTPELLILIFRECPTFDLLRIARTCHRLNSIAIHIYLTRLRVYQGLEAKEINLEGQGMRRVLYGLQSSVALPKLDRLSVKFTFKTHFTQDIQCLLAFISRCTYIREVILYFGDVDTFLDGHVAIIGASQSSLVELLSLLVGGKCGLLDVRRGHFVAYSADPTAMQGTSLVQESYALLRRPIITILRWLDALTTSYIRKWFIYHEPFVGGQRTLHSFRLNSDLFFTYPFYSWMIEMLRATPTITSISLQAPSATEDEWGTFLQSLMIPALTRIAFISPNIPLTEILFFVSRHPHLTRVDLPPHSRQTSPSSREHRTIWKLRLPALTRLGGCPRSMNLFIAHCLPFPSLRHFSLSLPSFKRDIKSVNSVIATTIENHQPRILTLDFIFPSAFDELDIYSSTSLAEASSCPSPTVEDVRFRSDGSFAFSRRTLPLLPPWLATFPALRRVSFVTNCLYCETDEWKVFLGELQAACPLLEDVQVYDENEEIGDIV